MGTLTTRQRFEALRKWLKAHACAGRELKAPGGGIADIDYREPEVYVAHYPVRPQRENRSGVMTDSGDASAPSILIMLMPSQARNMEEERYDRQDGIYRPAEFGGKLNIQLLFNVYEPGNRLPGFDGNSPELIEDATGEGFYTLTDWMDDVQRTLLTQKSIPGTDMYLWENSIQYAPYIESDYVADRRPFFYGCMSMTFGYYAGEKVTDDRAIEDALDG